MFKLLRAGFTIALLFITSVLFAQPYRQLTVNDFLGSPKINNRGVVGYTNCTIDFSFQASHRGNDYLVHFNVRLNMNADRSWLDRSRITSPELLAEVLKHEQGHYNIAYLEQQEVIRKMAQTRFTANYKNEAMAIFNRIDAKYKQLNIDYDEDTEHMGNRQQQHSWDIYFTKRLDTMPASNASL
ncbi:DUF922 domain-containing protein [Mucilaginibacter segetis]|uniref:DUF922 domain-containing protein n=1 Tax=Mucilaginibacter segetis TaxID=2793071 RepID=A0A934PS22_9SPHI|nr:DUF922 domain-containing protein [Mucilaginibacter segetis]MBK0379744.1 DUF922 domain-containing protein [Mucilaginibacter segetis]